ncbi:related to polyketide synthase [Fusarium fujikuroi]|nr:related to polyketide synthase [Fusarium fujikuroi]
MAYEAAIRLVSPAQEIQLVELHDIDVFRALSLKADSPGTEILFAVRITSQSDGAITASWSCYSNPVDFEHGQNLGDIPSQAESHVEGFLRIELGAPRDNILPARSELILPLIPLDVEELYDTLAVLGHGYKEHFQTPKMLRRLHHAVVSMPAGWKGANSLTRSDVNPAALDTGIRGLLAGYSCPGDRQQPSAYLPSRIDSIRVSMAVPTEDGDGSTELSADSFVTHGDASRISGDINVFNPESNKTHVQIRGVHLLNLPGSLRSSRETHHQDIWERDALCGIEPDRKSIISDNRTQISNLAMRLVLFYCQKVLKELKSFEIMLMGKARKNFLTWVQKVLIPSVRAGEHEASKDWLDDSEAELKQEVERLKAANSADVVLLERLGRNLTTITRGLTAGVKVAEQENALQRFYADSFGFRETTADAAALVSQICHRYPAMKMIEVGAGFGSGLRDALINAAGKRRYASYTVTNTVEPSDNDSKLIFKLLDIDKDPVQQGFVEASYDLVIATTSYSTNVSQETVINARKLLRPGGFLLLVALTNDYLPVRFVQSLLPRTWLEKDDSQPQIIKVSECDALLKVNGFSGVDVTYTQHFCSVMLPQAVDDVVLAVRDPITATQKIDPEILLVLDPSPSTIVENLASQLEDRLASFATVRKVSGLENINVAPEAIILNLCDLDTPVFQEMSELRFKGLQEIMRQASVLLWVTEGARGGAKPANTMVLGWGRSARLESSTVKLQILDIEQESHTVDPDIICKLLLNLCEGAVIPVEHISKKSPSSILPTSVLDRTTTTTITAKLLPPNHDGIFSSDKTYLLLGLAGDFGISITLWMFDSGARHVVLASRNPVVLQPVVDHAVATHGATLRFMAIDICDEGSLSAAWTEIHASMPPVGGIMNGAMLMRDQLFADQPWSDFSAVMGPKVRGTQNLVALLDREVAPEQLDFVIFLSSAVAVAGNAGQTAYGSSNWFMQGTASNMRQRGYPGCVVHIGGVSGLGYVQRHEKRKMLEDSLYWLMSPVSETDLHDMLAEVIAGGRHDLITGIRGYIRTYTCREQPRLWHYLQSEDDSNDETTKEGSSASLKIQLASSVADPDACLDLLLGGFTSALCGMLHMKVEELDTNVPVASIGIDSLVAVRVREWFMQQVGVEVSVLKVMSLNTPLLALCKDVLAIWRKQVKA